MTKKLIITEKINLIIKKKKLTPYKISKLIGVSDSALYGMIKGDTAFSKSFIEKLLPILEVSKEEFVGWIVADKYSKKVIEQSIEVKKAFPYKRKSILTTNVDKILQEKNMSRTALSKLIKYSQSSFNNMITGKEALSPTVIQRIAPMLEVSEDTVRSWHIADKYSLRTLEFAFESCLEYG